MELRRANSRSSARRLYPRASSSALTSRAVRCGPARWVDEPVCNRYRLTHSQVALAKWFGASAEFDDAPRFNIAPTQPVLTVRRKHGQKVRRFSTMRWGLIPRWAKDMTIGTR